MCWKFFEERKQKVPSEREFETGSKSHPFCSGVRATHAGNKQCNALESHRLPLCGALHSLLRGREIVIWSMLFHEGEVINSWRGNVIIKDVRA